MFFYLMPRVGKLWWPLWLDLADRYNISKVQLVVATQLIFHATWILYSNLSMYVIYKMKHPFFEQFKVNNDPWPWDENPEEWRKMLKKSISLVAFNGLVVLPISATTVCWLFMDWKYDC